jgi:protein TonB
MYGELVMILTVNHDGRVLSTEIVQGSGNRLLDTRAEAIARAAGPFGHFGPAMRAKADQIAVVSRFKFTREQTLQTTVQ